MVLVSGQIAGNFASSYSSSPKCEALYITLTGALPLLLPTL